MIDTSPSSPVEASTGSQQPTSSSVHHPTKEPVLASFDDDVAPTDVIDTACRSSQGSSTSQEPSSPSMTSIRNRTVKDDGSSPCPILDDSSVNTSKIDVTSSAETMIDDTTPPCQSPTVEATNSTTSQQPTLSTTSTLVQHQPKDDEVSLQPLTDDGTTTKESSVPSLDDNDVTPAPLIDTYPQSPVETSTVHHLTSSTLVQHQPKDDELSLPLFPSLDDNVSPNTVVDRATDPDPLEASSSIGQPTSSSSSVQYPTKVESSLPSSEEDVTTDANNVDPTNDSNSNLESSSTSTAAPATTAADTVTPAADPVSPVRTVHSSGGGSDRPVRFLLSPVRSSSFSSPRPYGIPRPTLGIRAQSYAARRRTHEVDGRPLPHWEVSNFESKRDSSCRVVYEPRDGPTFYHKNLDLDDYHVMRSLASEQPYFSKYNRFFPKRGHFCCKACGNVLYDHSSKIDSGDGWPAFGSCVDGAVEMISVEERNVQIQRENDATIKIQALVRGIVARVRVSKLLEGLIEELIQQREQSTMKEGNEGKTTDGEIKLDGEQPSSEQELLHLPDKSSVPTSPTKMKVAKTKALRYTLLRALGDDYTEIHCHRCKSHLGDVLVEDNVSKYGGKHFKERHRVNGRALKYIEDDLPKRVGADTSLLFTSQSKRRVLGLPTAPEPTTKRLSLPDFARRTVPFVSPRTKRMSLSSTSSQTGNGTIASSSSSTTTTTTTASSFVSRRKQELDQLSSVSYHEPSLKNPTSTSSSSSSSFVKSRKLALDPLSNSVSCHEPSWKKSSSSTSSSFVTQRKLSFVPFTDTANSCHHGPFRTNNSLSSLATTPTTTAAPTTTLPTYDKMRGRKPSSSTLGGPLGSRTYHERSMTSSKTMMMTTTTTQGPSSSSSSSRRPFRTNNSWIMNDSSDDDDGDYNSSDDDDNCDYGFGEEKIQQQQEQPTVAARRGTKKATVNIQERRAALERFVLSQSMH